MKRCFRLIALLTLALALVCHAADEEAFASVREADRQRLDATIAGDTARLASLLSDDLRYAYSDGRLQTKPQLLAAVAANRIKYLSIVPSGLELQAISPDAVAMHGRARLSALANGHRTEFTLRFLSVWRREGGHWHLLAYQSSQLAEAR
jgi:ketosteroid isomerase-like protein